VIFWDSSAIVPLIVKEKESRYCFRVLSQDQEMLVWCLSKVEVKPWLKKASDELSCAWKNYLTTPTR